MDLSTYVIRRRLADNDIHHHRPAKKEHLSPRHKEQRVAFARAYIDKDDEWWRRVVFSDEKSFCSTTQGPLHVYRIRGSRFQQQNIATIRRSGRITLNIWGWTSQETLGDVCPIDGRFNRWKYIELLENTMLPTVRARLDLDDDEKIKFV